MIGYWKDGLTNEQYHDDKDTVSSSGLKLLIEETPDVFEDRIIKGNQKPSTDAMNVSTLVHHAVLEGEDFLKRYAVKPKYKDNTGKILRGNSNLYKEMDEEWEAAHKGRLIVTQDELDVIEGTYESIFKHTDAALLLKGAQFERSGYYVDPHTGIKCRIRYDAYDRTSRILTDIKAIRSATPSSFSYAIRDYRWDLSMAMYGQGIFNIDDDLPDDYVFIAVEKTRPYRCAVYQLGQKSLELGLRDYRLALQKLAKCRQTGHYPSLQERLEVIELPNRFLEESYSYG